MPDYDDNLAAVVVHYKSSLTLQSTISDLRAALPPSKIFVIDNSSELQGLDWLSGVCVIAGQGNVGYGAAVNLGINIARKTHPGISEILVSTHESRFESGAISDLLRTAQEIGPYHIVAPLLFTRSSGRKTIWSVGGTLSWPARYPKHHVSTTRRQLRPVDWVDGAAFIISHCTWEAVGGVPEVFFLYMEDVALGLLCKEKKIPVIVDQNVEVEQTSNGPSRGLAIRNRLILAELYFPTRDRLLVKLELVLRAVAFTILPSVEHRAKLSESRLAWAEAKDVIQSVRS